MPKPDGKKPKKYLHPRVSPGTVRDQRFVSIRIDGELVSNFEVNMYRWRTLETATDGRGYFMEALRIGGTVLLRNSMAPYAITSMTIEQFEGLARAYFEVKAIQPQMLARHFS